MDPLEYTPVNMYDDPYTATVVTTDNFTQDLVAGNMTPVRMTNYTRMNLANALFQAKVFRIGYGYVLFSICFAGVCGNLLVFCVLTRKALRTSTTAVYLQVLAITDTLVLVTAVFRYQSYKIFMTDSASTSAVFHFDPYIQVYVEPIFWISLGVSSFVTLLLSTERYLAVKYPLTMKRTCTVQLVCVCIGAVILSITVITVPLFFSYEIREVVFRTIHAVAAAPTAFGLEQQYVCTYTQYIIPIVWYMCPWVILAVVNTLLARHVRQSMRIRVGVPNISNPNRNLSFLIIVVVIIYMICNFPACIISLMKLFDTTESCLKETRTLGNPEYTRSYLIAVVVAHVLNVLNSCANIIVYCVVGSKFRTELKRLILCEPCHKHTTIHISNTVHVTVTRDTTDTRSSPPPAPPRNNLPAM